MTPPRVADSKKLFVRLGGALAVFTLTLIVGVTVALLTNANVLVRSIVVGIPILGLVVATYFICVGWFRDEQRAKGRLSSPTKAGISASRIPLPSSAARVLELTAIVIGAPLFLAGVLFNVQWLAVVGPALMIGILLERAYWWPRRHRRAGHR